MIKSCSTDKIIKQIHRFEKLDYEILKNGVNLDLQLC